MREVKHNTVKMARWRFMVILAKDGPKVGIVIAIAVTIGRGGAMARLWSTVVQGTVLIELLACCKKAACGSEVGDEEVKAERRK